MKKYLKLFLTAQLLVCSAATAAAAHEKQALPALSAETHDLEAQLKKLDQQISQQPEASAYYMRAKIHEKQENLTQALLDCQKAIALQPAWGELYVYQGIVLSKMHLFDRALASYTEARKHLSDTRAIDYNEGRTLFAKGEYADSALALKRFLQLEPQHAEGHFCLGLAQEAQEQESEALAAFSEALRLQPDMAAAYHQRGLLHYKQGNYQQARADYQVLNRLHPDNSFVQGTLGWFLILTQDLSQAEVLLKEVLQREPELFWVKMNLGHVYLLQNKHQLALTFYQNDTVPEALLKEALRTDFKTLRQEGLAPEFLSAIEAKLNLFS